ncbi:unnamed protein product, partial [Mesorhabditis spiculigera]
MGRLLRLLTLVSILFTGILAESLVLQNANGKHIDVYVWTCTNGTVREVIIAALEAHVDVDSLYRTIWGELGTRDPTSQFVVYIQKYLRITANLLPGATGGGTRDLCLVQATKQNIAVIVARVKAPDK